MSNPTPNISISKKLKRKATQHADTDASCSDDKAKVKRACSPVADTLRQCTFHVNDRMAEIKNLGNNYMVARKILQLETNYCEELMHINYGSKVTHVYNPVDYAYKPHIEFYRKYCKDTARVLLIGENPGPFGGAQTGIPFGDVTFVKDWLHIEEMVGSPENQHPKRPVLGFSLNRSEGSGTRLWSFLKEQFGTADEFFSECFVYNYCPLIFMNESGGNVTPSTMPAAVKSKLNEVCDRALGEVLSLFPNCQQVVGIGRFTEQRLKHVCKMLGLPHKVTYMVHPSPRNPEASKNWALTAYNSFVEFKLLPKH